MLDNKTGLWWRGPFINKWPTLPRITAGRMPADFGRDEPGDDADLAGFTAACLTLCEDDCSSARSSWT